MYFKSFKNMNGVAGEMAQLVKLHAAKCSDLSSTPRACTAEGESGMWCDRHTCAWYAPEKVM